MLASCEPEKARMEHRRLCSLCFLPYPFLLPEANGMEFEQVRERESWGGIDGQVDGAGVRSAIARGGWRRARRLPASQRNWGTTAPPAISS